jgi:hypothetical protein
VSLPAPYAYLICLQIDSYRQNPPRDGNDAASRAASYAALNAELQASENWWHYLDFVWIVLRREDMLELTEKVRSFLQPEDRFIILPARQPANGFIALDGWDWVNKHLPVLPTHEWPYDLTAGASPSQPALRPPRAG